MLSCLLTGSIYALASDPPDNSKRLIEFYGCTDYSSTFHCDPLHNKIVATAYSGSSIPIHELTDPKPHFVAGKYERAIDMIAHYREAIHIPSISNISFNNFSVSFWVKSSTPEPVGHILSYTNSHNTAGWFFDMTANNASYQKVRFVLTDRKGSLTASPDAILQPDTFHQIAGTFNGSIIKLFLDGNYLGETRYSGNYSGIADVPLTIGSAAYCASCNRWSGTLDDVLIFRKPLTADEIKGIFEKNIVPSNDSVVAHWTFDNQFKDMSGNNNSGYESTLLASMKFAPDGRLFFTEKNTGQILIMKDFKLLPKPFVQLNDYFVSWEQGLLGLTLDPKFEENHYVYAYYTGLNPATGEVFNRVVRFTDKNNIGTDEVILIDKIFAEKGYHSGGALAFGPDDKLYITVGDATEHPFAQDPSIPIGKVLRINRDGSIPPDNPFPNSPVFTIGNRNMFGIAFDKYGNGLISENGDYYYDEINLIKKGGNYGFPTFQPANKPPELSNSSIKPLRSYWDTIAPTQMIYYVGDKIPLFKDKFILGTYQGDIYALRLDNKSKEIVEENRIDLENYPFKPVVGIAESSDGDVYFGAYSVYKLNATNIHPKKEYLYPIEINSSSLYKTADIEFSPVESKLDIKLNGSVAEHTSTAQPSFSTLILKIPKKLLSDVMEVTNAVTNSPMSFTNSTSTDEFNKITIKVPTLPKLQLSIKGPTLATPGEQILVG